MRTWGRALQEARDAVQRAPAASPAHVSHLASGVQSVMIMTVPIRLTFKELPLSDALRAHIEDWTAKLEHLHDGILGCDVVVETPHKHQSRHRRFHVKIHLHLAAPAKDVVVSHDPGEDGAHDDPYVAVRDAFLAARRQLTDAVHKLRGEVKRHAAE